MKACIAKFSGRPLDGIKPGEPVKKVEATSTAPP
jgi:hypothetical protein